MIEYKTQGEQYHPATPERAQLSPMGTSAFTLGSRILSRPPNSFSDKEEKGETEVQHDKLPVMQVCPPWGPPSPPPPPPRGITAAVTPLAKAMAATKEKRVL